MKDKESKGKGKISPGYRLTKGGMEENGEDTPQLRPKYLRNVSGKHNKQQQRKPTKLKPNLQKDMTQHFLHVYLLYVSN